MSTASRLAHGLGHRLLSIHRLCMDSPRSGLDIGISDQAFLLVMSVEYQFFSSLRRYFHSDTRIRRTVKYQISSLSDSCASRLKIDSTFLPIQKYLEYCSMVSPIADAPETCDIWLESSSDSAAISDLARRAVRDYLREEHQIAEEEAEIISRSCPSFLSKLGKFLTSRLQNEEYLASKPSSYFSLYLQEEGGHICDPYLESVGKVPSTLDGNSFRSSTLSGKDGLVMKMTFLQSLGCPRHRLWQIVQSNLDILAWSLEELKRRVDFLKTNGLKGEDLIVLVSDPCVFSTELEGKLDPILSYLQHIGIEKTVLKDLLKFNRQGLINMPIATFRERVHFLLNLGLSGSETERCLRVFPQLVHLRLTNLSEKVEYFDRLGVERSNMVKMVAKLPSVFRHSIAKNLIPKIQLLESLGVSQSSIVKIIVQYPQFFGCSIGNLKNKIAFFQNNGLTGLRLVKMVTTHPRAFSFSVDANLSKKLQFLLTKGFEERSTSMARALASCLSISVDALESRFLNLQTLGFAPREVCELVKAQPTILCLSEKTIQTKMRYLVDAMGRDPAEVLRCPGFLLYSLELRIKPRHRVVDLLSSKGLLRSEAYSLSTILQPREKVFAYRFMKLDPECEVVYTSHLLTTA